MSLACFNTIAYLQTPPGRGGIAVIAIVGPGTGLALSLVFRPLASHSDGGQGMLQLGHIVDGQTVVDEAIVHAGADSVEINVHGGPIAAQAVMDLLETIGVRPASTPAPAATFNPSHPRLNNPAIGVEILACLPKARSPMVMLTLTQQWSGGISTLARQVLAAIVRGGGAGARSVRAAFVTPLREAADSYAAMQRLLEPCRVVLAGPPNAGKSTLANTLVGRPVSIVHETPGTTRDWVSELAIIDGAPIMLTDTAGLWHPPGEDGETQGDDADLAQSVDAQAVTRAKGQIAMADIVLLLVNEDTGDGGRWGAKGLMPPDARVVRVWAKADLRKPVGEFDIAVSAASGEGLAQLRQRILEELGLRNFDPSAPHAFTARQVDLLRATAQAIEDDQPALARSELAQLLEGR